MSVLRDLNLPSKLYDLLEKVGVSTIKEIIMTSVWDLKKLTNLNYDDIVLVKDVAANYYCPTSITGDELLTQSFKLNYVSTGCEVIDTMLHGGFRRHTITELYGESGSGKTQLALQTALSNWRGGIVFICTEDTFPVRRFKQMTEHIKDYNGKEDYGKSIFVEHITEAKDLLVCLRVRLPKLLSSNKVSLIILDSIAAPFRSEYTNYIQRAEELRELAMSLIKQSLKYKLAILCINQATTNIEKCINVLPSLGLAWSNVISTRLYLSKTSDFQNDSKGSWQVRELAVEFSPEIPNNKCQFIITPKGIEEISLSSYHVHKDI